MRKTFESILVLIFQIALLVTLFANISPLKTITTVILFPLLLFVCMLTTNANGEKDLCFTSELLVVLIQALIWENAFNMHGFWIVAFLASVPLATGWVLYRIMDS